MSSGLKKQFMFKKKIERKMFYIIYNNINYIVVSRYRYLIIIKLRLWSSDDRKERNRKNRLNCLILDMIMMMGTYMSS